MLDPELDPVAKSHVSHSDPGSMIRLIVLTGAGLLLSIWLGLGAYDRIPFTCAACRANKVAYHLAGLEWSRQQDSDSTEWYSAHVETSHAHVWVQRPHCRRIGIPGLFVGYGCSMGTLVAGLAESVQREIYDHFQDKLAAKRLFLQLGSTGSGNQRLYEELLAWANAGYPGTWDDWWKQRGEPSQ